MKKLLLLTIIAGVFFTSCAPSGKCYPSRKSRDWAVIYDIHPVQYGWRFYARYNIGRWRVDLECKQWKIGDTVVIKGWQRVSGLGRARV